MRTISAKVSPAQHEALLAHCGERGLTLSERLRELIGEVVENDDGGEIEARAGSGLFGAGFSVEQVAFIVNVVEGVLNRILDRCPVCGHAVHSHHGGLPLHLECLRCGAWFCIPEPHFTEIEKVDQG